MYLLIIILHKEEYLDDVLETLVELGVDEAITVEVESLGKALAYKVPIFAGLRLGIESKPYSRTIFAVTDDPQTGRKLIEMLRKVDIDLEAKGVARILTVKLESIYGTPEEITEI